MRYKGVTLEEGGEGGKVKHGGVTLEEGEGGREGLRVRYEGVS